MKVTYLSHCGFAITLDEAILVFDYLRDPSHALHHILDQNPDKPVIFFISHSLVNNSHFNPGTFEIAQNHKRFYVVSHSLPAMYIPDTLDVAGMSKGDIVENLPGGIKVEAFGTTEKGVSFMLTLADGRHIFFAGELNEWDMPDETGKQEFQKMDNKFKAIVDRISSKYPEADVVMMAVNPRISLDFARGARMLCEKVKVKDFFPMDIDGDAKDAARFADYLPAATRGHMLEKPGESVNLDKAQQK